MPSLTGDGIWYSAYIIATKRGTFDLQYADGDKEFLVPSSRVRPQQFSAGDIVEANSGGKGVWFRCTVVEEMEAGALYKVRYQSDSIRWVSDQPIKGRDGKQNNLPLCVYGLLGWRIFRRDDTSVIIRRPPLPPPYRGCAAAQKARITKIRTRQRRWLRDYWRGKSSKKQNVVVASFLMAQDLGEELVVAPDKIKAWQEKREVRYK